MGVRRARWGAGSVGCLAKPLSPWAPAGKGCRESPVSTATPTCARRCIHTHGQKHTCIHACVYGTPTCVPTCIDECEYTRVRVSTCIQIYHSYTQLVTYMYKNTPTRVKVHRPTGTCGWIPACARMYLGGAAKIQENRSEVLCTLTQTC